MAGTDPSIAAIAAATPVGEGAGRPPLGTWHPLGQAKRAAKTMQNVGNFLGAIGLLGCLGAIFLLIMSADQDLSADSSNVLFMTAVNAGGTGVALLLFGLFMAACGRAVGSYSEWLYARESPIATGHPPPPPPSFRPSDLQ
jgi:hypothetical protein